MVSSTSDSDYSSSEYEEEEQKQEKIILSDISDSSDSDYDEENDMDMSPTGIIRHIKLLKPLGKHKKNNKKENKKDNINTNLFTCYSDKNKDDDNYQLLTQARIYDRRALLCCSEVRANLNDYFVLTEKQIRESLQNKLTLYEVIYGFKYIKPYIDLDMDDEFEDDEVINTFDNVINTLKGKLDYVIGGYTSINSIHDEYKYIELKNTEKTHKKLSLRIFAYKYAIDINKSLAFWVEYVGMDKELIAKNIIDPSVYKAADKQQKLRLLQSNKTRGDNKGVNAYYICKKNNDELLYNEGFKVKYLSATWTKDAELFDSSKLTDNETLKKTLKGKTTKDNKDNTTKDNTNKDNKDNTNNDNNKNTDDITPLLSEKDLLKLLNLFPTDWEYIEKVVSSLCHSPYPKDVIKRVCYDWYNSIEHTNGDKTADYIDRYYEYTKSNKWFNSIIKQYYTPKELKDFGWTDEDEKIYNKLAFKPNNKLSSNQRKQKEEIKDKYADVKNKLKESLTEEDKEKNKNRKYFVNLFRDIKRIITPYEENGSYYNMLFIDRKHNAYLLNERNRLEQINKENYNAIIKDYKINEKYLTIIGNIDKYNYIRKYNDVFVSDEYNDKVQESLNIFKSGFVNEYDYMYYMRWLSTKFNDPYTVLPRNIVCLLGTGSFKSTFIDSIKDFIKVSKINYSNDITNSFNEWIDSSIVVIDEVPQSAKDVERLQNDIKTMSGAKTVKINRKFEHEAMIDNCANFIINSNYLNCGGMFSNQTQGEMFRRFRVIKKQIINQDDADILYDNLNNKHILYNIFEYIKNEFKPMNVKEFQEVSEYEKEYMQTVKNTNDNKHVLDKDTIEMCVDKKKRLCIKYLVDRLLNRSYKTTIASEKMFLIQSEVCKIDSARHLIITDYDKFVSIYLNDEFEEENEEEDKPEHVRIINEN